MPPTQFVAVDAETCPRRPETLSESHRERRLMEAEQEASSPAGPTDEEASKAAALHPMLGWICCISVVAGTPEDGPREPRSWVASDPGEEKRLLQDFWSAVEVADRCNSPVRWVSFNGKRFDVPYLSARSAHHGIAVTSKDLLDTHKYRSDRHLDLSNIWQPVWYGLEDMCDHLGVKSPKTGPADESFDGSDVAPAVRNGDIEKVRHYCERDAEATFRCAQEIVPLLP